jgi:hypothetical protein
VEMAQLQSTQGEVGVLTPSWLLHCNRVPSISPPQYSTFPGWTSSAGHIFVLVSIHVHPTTRPQINIIIGIIDLVTAFKKNHRPLGHSRKMACGFSGLTLLNQSSRLFSSFLAHCLLEPLVVPPGILKPQGASSLLLKAQVPGSWPLSALQHVVPDARL